MVNFIKAFLLTAALWLVACSSFDDGEERALERYDEFGVRFSPTEVQGSVQYLPSMTPEYFRIVTVDRKLNPRDSFELYPVDVYKFIHDNRDYEYPYLKIVTVFPAEGEQKQMEFVQYMRLSRAGNFSKLNQNFYAALASKRIETLVQKEDYDFDDAVDTAFAELGRVFGVDLSDVYGKKYDLAPFVYCRHEISDSVFYHDFIEFRDSFAKSGSIDSSIIVRAADAWLSTFEQVYEKGYLRFKSGSRDKDYDDENYSYKFFSGAYGIGFPRCDTCYSEILNKKSAYYGRKFICEYDGSNWNNTFFRLPSLLEDTLGLCKVKAVSIVEHNGMYYLCKNKEFAWKTESNRDTILTYKYGACGGYYTRDHAFYLKDSLFFCECDSKNKCAWTNKYANTVFHEGDSLYAEVLHAKALDQFGECKDDGNKKQLDSVFVQCSFGRWAQIDSLMYYLGGCTKTNQVGKHLGVYYSCKDYWAGSDSPVWREVYPPVYYNDTCDSRYQNHTVKYDGAYFICEADYCVDEDGFVKSGCWGIGHWRTIEDDEMIPPMIDNVPCNRDRINEKVAYGDEFYICRDGRWYSVGADSVMAPEKDGLFCTDSLYGLVKRYNGDYYVCESVKTWRKMSALEAGPYEYRDSLGACSAISQKTIHWSEKADSFFGCAKMDSVWDWHEILLGAKPYTMPKSFKRENFKGGKIDKDSIYTVEVENSTYRFILSKNTMYLTHVDLSSGAYDAYFYNGNLFLHVERPQERLRVDSLKNTTEEFDTYYKSWKSSITSYSKCGGRYTANVDTVYLTRFDVDSYKDYMDWNRASKFCPDGFHIPSSEEFMQEDYIAYLTTNMDLRNDSPLMWDYYISRCSVYGNLIYFDLFWTSTEKDEKTQECFEYAWHHRDGEKGRRLVDCPKDLYPMVQALCVQDE